MPVAMAKAYKVVIASDLFGGEVLKMAFVPTDPRGHLQCARISISSSQVFFWGWP